MDLPKLCWKSMMNDVIEDRYIARVDVTEAPPWSEAWSWGSAHGTRLGMQASIRLSTSACGTRTP